MKLVGKTIDDRLVVDGVYMFHSTYGLPLEVIFDELKENYMIPCWMSLYVESINQGEVWQRFRNSLFVYIEGSYGTQISMTVINVLDQIERIRVEYETNQG